MIEYAVLVALVIATTKIIRTINNPKEGVGPYISESYLPLIAILVGVTLNCFSSYAGSSIVIDGIIASLVAMGLYDGVKGVKFAVKEIKSKLKK